MGEKKAYTCERPSCKTTFVTPLITLNMQKNPTEPYLACPNCLTKIDDSPLKMQVKARFIEEANIESQTQSNQKYSKNPEKPTACKNHFGYLNERKQKEHVPDDCFLCEKIVDCMLKSLREEQ